MERNDEEFRDSKYDGVPSWRRELTDVVRILVISLAIVLPIRYFIVQPFVVRGASMEPNFEDREYLIIDEASYYLREPRRGEVVVFRYPKDPRQYFIKRIVGLPGETVEIRQGRIFVANSEFPSGFAIVEEYLDSSDRFTAPEGTTVLGEREYFVLGDNRDASSDSRAWGALERGHIVGRAFLRAWPVGRAGLTQPFLER